MKNSLSYNNLSVQNKKISNILLSDRKNFSESKKLKLKPKIKENNEFKLPSINIMNPLLNFYIQNHKIILNDINKNIISSIKKKNAKFLIDKYQPQNDFNQENFLTFKNKIQNYMKSNINRLENEEMFFIKNYQYKNNFNNNINNNSNNKIEIKKTNEINKFIFQNKKKKIMVKNLKIIYRNKESELKNSNSLDLLTIKDRKKKILDQLEKMELLNEQEEVFENKLIDIKNIDNNKEDILKNEKKKINKKYEYINMIKYNEVFEKKLKKSNSNKIILNKFLDECTQT